MTKVFAQGCAYLTALCALSRIKLPASEWTCVSHWSPACDVLMPSLLPSPQTELPPSYSPWMDIAHELPKLIASHQLRACIHQMPQLNTQHLRGREELHLAHLVLSFLTMGYVWQEGEEGTMRVLPRNLAVPFWEVSQALGLPPILTHADFVLANWRRKDPSRPLEIENLEPIISLPGGESLHGFILVTLLVEKAAVPGIKVGCCKSHSHLTPQVFRAHLSPSLHALLLLSLQATIQAIHALQHLDDELLIFLSGWRDNAAMPHGLLYEGVSEQPMAFSGGSAAQSSVLHAFDELLGIQHSQESTAFLHRMRDYMPPPHRAFIRDISRAPSLRQHILSSADLRLREAFNHCITALADFRSHHIAIVTKYIAVAKAKAGQEEACSTGKPPAALEAKGTGGSHIFIFLKSVRDSTREGLISA
uniref:Indoleamine 2,3-dioxygenase 2 n=1 Tax=Pavo cristatus TaxID=9049 RepID=A0A8C9LE56_PAVCR